MIQLPGSSVSSSDFEIGSHPPLTPQIKIPHAQKLELVKKRQTEPTQRFLVSFYFSRKFGLVFTWNLEFTKTEEEEKQQKGEGRVDKEE